MKHMVSVQLHLLRTVMEVSIQVSVTLLSQQVAAEIQVIVVLGESQKVISVSVTCSVLLKYQSSRDHLATM